MAEEVKKVVDAVPMLLDFPARKFHVDYDKDADVLYISFERPQKATDTEVTDEGIAEIQGRQARWNNNP